MANPFFQAMRGGMPAPMGGMMGGPMGGMMDLMGKVQQFRQQFAHLDPQAEVKKALQGGNLTPDQCAQVRQMAAQMGLSLD